MKLVFNPYFKGAWKTYGIMLRNVIIVQVLLGQPLIVPIQIWLHVSWAMTGADPFN